MGLLSFLKRQSGDAPKASSSADAPDAVQQARTRARQRLIGAAVLVVAGVIGFPMLFATQPRSLSVDTPIELARRDGTVAAPALPRGTPATPVTGTAPSGIVTESATEAGRDVTPPDDEPATAAEPTPPPADVAPAERPVEPRPAPASAAERKPPKPADVKPPKPADKPAVRPADATRAQALLDGRENAKPAADKPAADKPGDAGRFVVQVGAYGEMAAARDARQKVEKLGLKTYTQVVETSAGNRIRVRVGPFSSRADAERAAAKVKATGLGSAVFTL